MSSNLPEDTSDWDIEKLYQGKPASPKLCTVPIPGQSVVPINDVMRKALTAAGWTQLTWELTTGVEYWHNDEGKTLTLRDAYDYVMESK